MMLPNNEFEDYPVEFNRVNTDDFPSNFSTSKIIINPDSEGYLNDNLQDNIELNDRNTVVINAGVGSGKTFAVIQTVKRFYEDHNQEYLIFIASPFVSLVQQYYLDVQELGVPENQIYRYEWIGRNSIEYLNRKIQIITANTLLGNPGEDGFINSKAKREYLNRLVQHCEENEIKVVVVYDEIHDAVYNFKQNYIFNLWKWKNVIHKNIVVSATLSESSKIVIEYLAELTDLNIKILEAERIRINERQSQLLLHFDNAKSYTNHNGTLIDIAEECFSRNLDVDILCSTRKLANSIYHDNTSGLGEILYNKYRENINLCVANFEENQEPESLQSNRYDHTKCNIGTNFSTGVSIKKENHAFIVVLPAYTAKGPFKNHFGIFSNGYSSIIQALARKRTVGEIHIVLPKPQSFNYETLSFSGEKYIEFKKAYDIISTSTGSRRVQVLNRNKAEYISFDKQREILCHFYNDELRASVEDSIRNVDRLRNNNLELPLQYPSFKTFTLNDGDKYLTNEFPFFGKDPSTFLTYSAFTNQFVNCNLAFINKKPVQYFKEGKIQFILNEFFKNYLGEDFFNSLLKTVNNTYIFAEFMSYLFDNNTVIYRGLSGDSQELKSSDKKLVVHIIAFIQYKLFPQNLNFKQSFVSRNGFYVDGVYRRSDYFMSCISHSKALIDSRIALSDNEKGLVLAYNIMDYFRVKMKDSIRIYGEGQTSFQYLSKTPSESFIGEDINEFREMRDNLLEFDRFIINEIFTFKNNFTRRENFEDESKQIKGFYKYLKTDFFEVTSRRINIIQHQENVDQINNVLEVPQPTSVLNLILDAAVDIPLESLPVYSPDSK